MEREAVLICVFPTSVRRAASLTRCPAQQLRGTKGSIREANVPGLLKITPNHGN
jgi:hypothetical protein